eukprot:gene13430-biopygen6948
MQRPAEIDSEREKNIAVRTARAAGRAAGKAGEKPIRVVFWNGSSSAGDDPDPQRKGHGGAAGGDAAPGWARATPRPTLLPHADDGVSPSC